MEINMDFSKRRKEFIISITTDKGKWVETAIEHKEGTLTKYKTSVGRRNEQWARDLIHSLINL